MDESTFETFEEELGTPLQETPQPKPHRQSRRPEIYPRRVREEPPVAHQVPKSAPREAPSSRGIKMYTIPPVIINQESSFLSTEDRYGLSLRKTLSMQNVAQFEPPWQGVTLNRCIFIAITILVLTSGCQRLNEFLRGRKDTVSIDAVNTALNVRHAALTKRHSIAPEPETSLWDAFFLWVSDDDDKDEIKQGKSRKETRSTPRSLRHKAIPDRKLLKEKKNSFNGRSRKVKQDEESKVKAQGEKVKSMKERKMGQEEKIGKKEELTKESTKRVPRKVKEKI